MSLRGRQYHVVIDIRYSGRRLPSDVRDALTSMIQTVIDDGVSHLSFAGSSRPYGVLTVRATVRASSPVDALNRLDTSLNQSLMATGLYEEFDVTGKAMQVAPLELAEQPGHGIEE
jgi:hypothetical protein